MRIVWALVLLSLIPSASFAAINSPSDLSSVGCQIREVCLGDLVADAVKSQCGAPAALIPAGSLREITIPKGNFKVEDILKCLQYPDDKLVVMVLTGDQILRGLERSVAVYSQKNLGFLQVSGIAFKFDPDATKGSKVLTATIGGETISKDRKYRIATTASLAYGAYGYFTIWGKDQPKETKDITTEQAVENFLSGKDSVNYQNLNRIVAKSE